LDAAISAEERERREESATRRLLKKAQAEKAELEDKVDLLTAIDGVTVQPSRWTQPAKQAKRPVGVANLLLSDLHLDEVVRPEQVNGRNAYDRRIAERRLQQTVERAIRVAREHINITLDGIQVWWGGDTVSGNIHDELRKTNSGQDVVDTIDHWSDPFATALVTLADHFGHVHVVSVVGNHGRSTKKPEAKNAVRSSFDWLFARGVYRALRSDERITWNIPEALTVRERVLGTTYHFEHGDNFQGGDQIAGPIRPLLMGFYRRLAEGDPFDVLVAGHFHMYAAIPQVIGNGSLVGYTEHSLRKGYRFDVPKQAFWVETPEHGPSFHLPILPMDRRSEKW
jgi:hypothetical protein